jgi:PadR family transcriptional regulator PadR
MAKTINSDLIRGNINTIILKALYDSDRYGYDIIKEIEVKSHGQYILKQPTLYSCLKRLETQGFIEAYWGEEPSGGGRRKYYRLTDEGRKVFKQSQDEYEYSRTVIDGLISKAQYALPDYQTTDNTDNNDEISANTDETAQTIASPFDTQSTRNDEESVQENSTSSPFTQVEPDKQQSYENVYDYSKTINYSLSDEQTADETANKSSENTTNDDLATKLPKEKDDTEFDELHFDTSSVIDAMLSSGEDKSYFTRNTTDTKPAPSPNNSSTVEPDEIAKKLEELRSVYEKEYDSLKESEDNENYDNGFLKYNVKHSQVNVEKEDAHEKISLNDLLARDTSRASSFSSETSSLSIKEKIMMRKYGKLSQSIADLGENPQLRPSADTKHDYKKLYYFRDTYMRLFFAGIMFLMMLFEIFAAYVLSKLFASANTKYDIPVFIGAIALNALYPLLAATLYIVNPTSKKRNDFNFKTSFWFRFLIASISDNNVSYQRISRNADYLRQNLSRYSRRSARFRR